MLKGSLWAMLAAGVMMSMGCGFQQGTAENAAAVKGGLAVIDLDVVAKSIGRTQEINESWQVRKNALDQALQKLQANFNEQLTAKKTEFGEEPTEEQQKQLANMRQDAANKLVQAGRTAQGDLEKFRQKMVADFRTEMRPYAQQVASSKGLGIVIPKNEGFLLSVDPGVDITADVIAAYSAKAPAAKPAAAPATKPLTPSQPATETATAPEASETR